MFARVAVPRPLYQTFIYRIPDSLADRVVPGSRVIVPFGRSQLTGWADEIVSEPQELPARVRAIIEAPDPTPALDDQLLELCRWVSRYYVAPIGLTFRTALPSALTSESTDRLVRLAATREPPTEAERKLLGFIEEHKGGVKLGSVRKALGPGPWTSTARKLADLELIEIRHESPDTAPPARRRKILSLTRELASLKERDEIFGRARRQRELYEYVESVGGRAEVVHLAERLGISHSVVQGLVERGLAMTLEEEVAIDPFASQSVPKAAALEPTQAQSAAIQTLVEASRRPAPEAEAAQGVFVLKGVTGSGKTLVYIELLRELVERRGKGAILLVPEIALTPQTLSRFRAAFGDNVAVLHSALSEGERYSAWRSTRTGEKRIVVGARSAVFAPVQDLGVVILDEEHEGSYKQSDPSPRYHAREVAVMRARQANALCILGSATPSLEAWANARSGKWGLIELPERVLSLSLPAVSIVDLREERRAASDAASSGNGRPPRTGPVVLSAQLENALSDRLRRGEQAILLLNRRGYATFIQCRDCGAVIGCRRCNVSLTRHRRPPRLVCHYCNHQEPIPEACTECGSEGLSHRGVGTEQVERVLGESFPGARVARMDVDTTSAKWSHHEILGRFERGEADVLLGTQMIAKGLDFPNVTLVGVINADVGLNLPDFRASERTFQLLTQVAGRAGRGPAGGEVIIQTALPRHYAIQFAITHDYDGFAGRELDERLEPRYPPHTRLANLVLSGRVQNAVQETASRAADWLEGLLGARSLSEVNIVGPAPCPIDRIRGRWRWHLLLKTSAPAQLGQVLEYFARKFDTSGSGDLRVEIDRDPVSLL